MPYITQDRRTFLETDLRISDSLKSIEFRKGDLNYVITYLIKKYVDVKGKSYDTLSDITEILNDVKTEFERCVVAPYEEQKIKLNGKIY